MSYDLNVQRGLSLVFKSQQDTATQGRAQSGTDDRFWQQVFAEAGRQAGVRMQKDSLLSDQRSLASAMADHQSQMELDTPQVSRPTGPMASPISMLGGRDVRVVSGQPSQEDSGAIGVGIGAMSTVKATLTSSADVTTSTFPLRSEQIKTYQAGALDASRERAFGKYAFTLVKGRNGFWVIYLRAPESMSAEQALMAAAQAPLSQLKSQNERVHKVYLNGHLIYQFRMAAMDHMSTITNSTGANRGHVQGSITS